MSESAIPMHTKASVDVDAPLIRTLARSGPRYTSYPTADRFSPEFGRDDFAAAVADVRARKKQRALSMYLHIPFCDSVCYYCGCNKIVTKNRSKAATYLDYLKREITLQSTLFAGINQIEQLHLGGGTPTYLSDAQMGELMAHLRQCFDFADDVSGEYAIEIDPRTVSPQRIDSLRVQGFNRLSLGVQDFEPDVQRAVNRLQPAAQTLAIIAAARDAGFRSVSVDLIYGLPKQTMATMAQTLKKVIAANPDRLAIYNYAHMPHLFKPQRRLAEVDLPDASTRLDMLFLCIQTLADAGYIYIGMDHFAKPGDELALAQQAGRLHRNFQGYSTHAEADLVSCGVSAISAVGATYSQNVKRLDAYYGHIDQGELPIARGVRLSSDDLLRRDVIQRLMCHFTLPFAAIEEVHLINFTRRFSEELKLLQVMAGNGLVEIEADRLTVTRQGRLLIRNICMVFDRYLKDQRIDGAIQARFSKTI